MGVEFIVISGIYMEICLIDSKNFLKFGVFKGERNRYLYIVVVVLVI